MAIAEIWPGWCPPKVEQNVSGPGEELGQNISNIVTGTKCIRGESGTKCLLTIFFYEIRP